MKPIEKFTTEELINELMNRHINSCFVGQEKEGDVAMSTDGSLSHTLGLVEYAKARIMRYLLKIEDRAGDEEKPVT